VSVFLALVTGYLLGSFLPAYFLTKWILGIDIRNVGTYHAGTTNVYRAVGLWPAAVTALYDTTKGIMALSFARSLGVPHWVAYLSGYSAILGHVFPFYLQFRGGKGAATTVGLLLFFLWNHWLVLPLRVLLLDFLVLLSIVLTILWSSRRGDVVGLFVLPALGVLLWLRTIEDAWFVLLLIFTLFLINLKNTLDQKLIRFSEGTRVWRVLIRPAAIALLVLGLKMEKGNFLLLNGAVLLLFLLMDVIRLFSKRVSEFFHNEVPFKIFKEKERVRVSSMTLFLLGILLSFLLFDVRVAFVSGCFLTFGDLAAKIIGMSFGKRKLFEKTLEGSLAYLVVSVYVAHVASVLGFVGLTAGLLGALASTVCEVIPLSIDDNVSVPIFSALVMSLLGA